MAYVFTTVFTARSLALYARLNSGLPFTKRSQSVPVRSPFVKRSIIVQSDSMIFRLKKIHTSSLCIFFLITDETQCKQAHLIVVFLAFPQRLHIVYCAFTLCVRLRFVCSLRSFIVHSIYAPIKFCSACAHRSLRVRSSFTYRSSWKIKRFRDCISLTEANYDKFNQRMTKLILEMSLGYL